MSSSSSSPSLSRPITPPSLPPQSLVRLDCIKRVLTIVTIALFAITILFLALAQMGKIPPATPLYSFAQFVGASAICACLECYIGRVAQKESYPLGDVYKWRTLNDLKSAGESAIGGGI